MDSKPDIRSLTRGELAEWFSALNQPGYRVDQLLNWLYARRVTNWDAMTNLPRLLREKLQQSYALESLELVRKQGSHDTTQKFLWRLQDGSLIESVLIPANPALYGERSDRHTLCISTQVGCAYGCRFCASGLDGWKRDLSPNEIVEQVLAVERWHDEQSRVESQGPSSPLTPSLTPNPGERVSEGRERGQRSSCESRLIDNLVIMGMGEPLANYENLLKALRIFNAPWGCGIGARKITLSTSGLAPQIRRLADEPEQFGLAISLHGATDKVRSRIMPVNRKYPLSDLTAALEYYESKKRRMLTFEYILIAGVNDSLDQCLPLAALARRLKAKVNLIPYNTVEGLAWQRPERRVCEAFLEGLERQRIVATLRCEKGHDIDAACGQLRLRAEKEPPAAPPDPDVQGVTSSSKICSNFERDCGV